ncbi:arylesterase [Marinobacterium sedimentorum]|uniref:arylesterase n=1 Tax=Marinobacterium sedimentorum TaxID=2927804 RepID=UPI0020C6FF6E|nr:arylesterase [Marinobacterium sedimentorum]MCP8688969.1 arylesterase [Marinobacterium sedimentorum]
MFRLLLFVCVLLVPGTGAAQSILVLGDSLSAAYGMPVDQGWVALMRQRIEQRQVDIEVVNASISGETTQGGITRLPALLAQHEPDILILELGANDGLRGTPLPVIRQNLSRLITLGQEAGARVLLLGIRLPPNYGPRYSDGFYSIFAELSESQQVARVPFLMDGVALDRALMQNDGLHPNSLAQPRLLDNVWTQLQDLLAPAAAVVTEAG